jgi:hypothetical protein
LRPLASELYQSWLSRVNSVFCDALASWPDLRLSWAGEVLEERLEALGSRAAAAVVILDACRYEAGRRLAAMLNRGEPAERATVAAAAAPLPSVTAAGNGIRSARRARKADGGRKGRGAACVGCRVRGQPGDRREPPGVDQSAVESKGGAILSVGQVADASAELSVKTLGRLVFVFGDELDVDGHEDRLEPAGLDEHLERYAKAIRRLSRAGYANVLVTSDHGFFHWTSADNDFVPKPEGEIVWASRRCVIGSGLRGSSTLELPVSRSELCARTPWSVNVIQTRGGLRYFHGGSTLQELVLPVAVAHWPKKTEKVGAVIRPVESITNIGQRLEAAPGVVQQTLGGGVSGSLLSRWCGSA